MNNLNNLLCVLLCVTLVIDDCLSENSKTVTIKQGNVTGYLNDDGSIFEFFGIPYATAPTGDDKFKAPLPPPSWEGTLFATTKNVVCPQRQNSQIPKVNVMSINCLHINVFTPNVINVNEKLPVVLYIHGGAYQQGFGNEISPANIVKRGLVVANFNYRVGVHGFLCLGTEFAPGNAGLKDQVAALKWIKENIGNFGGDPDNVSVAGNSAGSSSVEFLILSKMSAGLFHKGLSETGSALSSWAVIDFPLNLAEHYANQFGVEIKDDVTALENFYKTLSVDDLKVSFNSSKIDIIGFTVCVEKITAREEPFITEKPLKIINSGNYNKVVYMTGFNVMEGIFFLNNFDNNKIKMEEDLSIILPVDIQYESENDKTRLFDSIKEMYFSNGGINYENYVNYLTDAVFSYAVVTSAILHNTNMPVYFYIFSFNGTVRLPSDDLPKMFGPSHGSQAMYVQKFSYGVGYGNMTENDNLISDRMITIWTNFFKYGKPIPSKSKLLPTELPIFSEEQYYLDINLEMNLQTKPIKERIAFWEDVYKKYRCEICQPVQY